MIDEPRKLTQMVTFMYGLCSGGNGYDSRFGSGLFRLTFSVVLLSPLQGKLWDVIKIWASPFPLIPFPIHYSLIVQQFDPEERGCWSGNALDLHSGEYRFECMPGHRMYWAGFSWSSWVPPRNTRIVPWLGHCYILPVLFLTIIHMLTYHQTLCSLDTESVVNYSEKKNKH